MCAMAKILGCNFEDTENLKTFYDHPSTGDPVVVILLPCHMVKLMRNTLEAKNQLMLVDRNNNKLNGHICRGRKVFKTTSGCILKISFQISI
jgi:hypothetical protein